MNPSELRLAHFALIMFVLVSCVFSLRYKQSIIIRISAIFRIVV